MERLGILEVLDRDGHARSSWPLHQWPVTVGRDVGNDVVLDDPHLAAHHFTLEATTAAPDSPQPGSVEPDEPGATPTPPHIVATVSASTRNGLRQGRKVYRAGQLLPLHSGSEWHAGATRLRLRLAGAPVSEELPLLTRTWWSLLNPALALLGIVLLHALHVYLQYDEISTRLVLEETMPNLITLGVWALLWAIVTRIFRHQMFFWRHTGIMSWAVLVMLALNYVMAGLSFSWSLPWLNMAWEEWEWLPLAVAVWAHLRIVLYTRTRVRVATALVLALALALALIPPLLRYADTGQLWTPWYGKSLGPPWLRASPTISVEQFRLEAEELEAPLRRKLEKLNAKETSKDLP
ncbi:hypothetical protein EBQ26_01055 [Allofranklinella schreckenbergeri]|uniref:FHA domain-containing protein n=1 Tax=Allofranklinella schreckenbergeri TaxID=1076744 RepID=A0A3M6QE66_9BURK|nr:FHA domain-containing protein [Allofranklinella schreckenbergeri]RMX01394.1 hypothetical protein EBQ26_01055 [Allofranklinella schreckenbergeri]